MAVATAVVRAATAATAGRRGWCAGRLARCASGIAAVEFALVLPVMVLMLLGVTEVTYGVNLYRKLTLVSRSIADMSSRGSQMSSALMKDIFGASKLVLKPFDAEAASVGITVSSVKVTPVGSNFVAEIDWTCSSGPDAPPQTKGDPATAPSAFKDASRATYFMWVQTRLPYKPMFGRTFTGTMILTSDTVWPVRDYQKVDAPSSCS